MSNEENREYVEIDNGGYAKCYWFYPRLCDDNDVPVSYTKDLIIKLLSLRRSTHFGYDDGVHVLPYKIIKTIPKFMECVNEYKECCVNPDVKPEKDFNFDCYANSDDNPQIIKMVVVNDNGECVGFACVNTGIYQPHLNVTFSAIDSVFIRKEYSGRYWNILLHALKDVCEKKGDKGIMIGASVGSRFDRYLSLKFTPLNTLYWISLK